MKRITEFVPAFDKRNTDPEKNYGIGALTCVMTLKGEEGATCFYFSTGIYLPYIRDQHKEEGFYPPAMGHIVNYHSIKPLYNGQVKQECDILDGKICYNDGSYLKADKWFNILVTEGDSAIWKRLEEYYNRIFHKEKVDAQTRSS